MTDFPLFRTRLQRLTGCLLCGGIFVFTLVLCSAQEAELGDIRDIVIRKPPGSLVPVILFVLVVVAFLIGGGIMLRRLLSREGERPGPPPERVAISRLRQISSHVEELDPNQASLETSETVKDFLSAQYGDPIRYETAEEYLARITATENSGPRLSTSLIEEVRSFMSISQELKFAKLREARSRIPALIGQAEAIIGMAMRDQPRRKQG